MEMFSKLLGDSSAIQPWISDEKELSSKTKSVGRLHGQGVAKSITSWGKQEAEDIRSISAQLATLHVKSESLHNWLADEFDSASLHLKEIKAREESLSLLKKKQKDTKSKLDSAVRKSLSAATIKADGVDALRVELSNLDRDVMVAVAEFEGFKREAFKNATKRKWNAVIEYSAKMLVLANFGNHIADQIPQGKLTPGYDLPAFKNDEILNLIMQDYETQSNQWRNYIPSDLNFTPTSDSQPTTTSPYQSTPHLPQPGPITPITPSAPEEIYSASLVTPLSTIPRNQTYTTPLFASTTDPEIFTDAIPVYPSTTTTIPTFTSPIQPHYTTPTPLNPATDAISRLEQHRPRSILAAAVAEAVGPLGRIPAGSGGSDDKKTGNPVVASSSVGDGVTEMLRQLPIAGVVAQQQQQDARRGSSLSLADAEDAVVKAGVKGNGGGVVGMLQSMAVAERMALPVEEGEVSNKPGKSIVGTFVVMFDYEQTPGKDDELTIRVGDLVAASNVYEDGWAVGRVLRTNKTGFFPFNAVYPVFSASGTPLRNAQEVPETVCGVAVSPSPTLLFQDGVISKEDYESIVQVMKEIGVM